MAHVHDSSGDSRRRVWIALLLTGSFMVAEVAGGIISGSLALLADAGHMLTDTMALALAAVAFRISSRPADDRLSYGYSRFQILAAFVNGLSLLLIVVWILYEAFQRLIDPAPVLAATMLVVAVVGLESRWTVEGASGAEGGVRGPQRETGVDSPEGRGVLRASPARPARPTRLQGAPRRWQGCSCTGSSVSARHRPAPQCVEVCTA